MRINVFPALNGDCILVEYVASHYILIDGGYVNTYNNYLLPKLVEIANNGGTVDVVVVTHIDEDHISGIIKLLEEDVLPISIKEIWYNGYKHVQSVAIVSEEDEIFAHKNICKETNVINPKSISAKQGCTLSTLIARKGLLWNGPTKGNAMKGLISYLLGGATIHILSPNNDDISNVELFWKKRLIKDGLLSKAHSNEYWDDAFEFCLSKEKPGFHFHKKKVSKSYDLIKIKEEAYVPDDSATNGSSIAFVLEVEGKRILFLGDAHAETIVESLITLYGEKNAPFRFDAVKLSHHGSFNNNSPKLLDIITCDNWLISTNGDKYDHPDLPTLAHIITNENNNAPKLYFNYNLAVSEELMKQDYHRDNNFEIIYPDDDGITITL
ncbi:MBL fold metallo-hydrolase [Paraprevotella xylaniphila]|uniref:MBL fold metallo-hydrolase n=1 Tax=Paraprevotella xylaniphila TaxID=454155 RepID=UPI001032D7A9|nr:MBL fold metallo-hydrolase [Paraprevotella xylaniphila]